MNTSWALEAAWIIDIVILACILLLQIDSLIVWKGYRPVWRVCRVFETSSTPYPGAFSRKDKTKTTVTYRILVHVGVKDIGVGDPVIRDCYVPQDGKHAATNETEEEIQVKPDSMLVNQRSGKKWEKNKSAPRINASNNCLLKDIIFRIRETEICNQEKKKRDGTETWTIKPHLFIAAGRR